MTCIITYENKHYTQKEFEQYFKEHFSEFIGNFLGSKQDIEGFKDFVNKEDLDSIENEESINFSLSEKVEQIDNLSRDNAIIHTIYPLISKLKNLFPNVRCEVISMKNLSLLPNEVKGKIAELNKLDKVPNSFFHNGTVYIIKERVNREIAIEEFLHPFVSTMEKSNSELYKNIMKELKSIYPEFKDSVFQKYAKVYASMIDLNNEFMSQALSKLLSEEIKTSDTLYQKVIDWFKNLINSLLKSLGYKSYSEISDFDPNMKLKELVALLSNPSTSIRTDITDTTNWSLDESELKIIQNLIDKRANASQKKVMDTLIEQNHKIRKIAEPGLKHYYLMTDEFGNDVQLDSVTETAMEGEGWDVGLSEESEHALFGNLIHALLKVIVYQRRNLSDFEVSDLVNTLKNSQLPLSRFGIKEEEQAKFIREVELHIYSYVSALKRKGSLLIPELEIGNAKHRIGGTTDIVEITTSGKLIIHDLKTKVLNKFSTKEKKLDPREEFKAKRYFAKQQGLYKRIIETYGIDMSGGGNIKIVPMIFHGKMEAGFTDTPNALILEPIKPYGNYVSYFPTIYDDGGIELPFQLNIGKDVTDFINNRIPLTKEEKQVLEELRINKSPVDSSKSQIDKILDSERFEKELTSIFAKVLTVVRTYGKSRDTLKAELYKVFDPSKDSSFGLIANTITQILEEIDKEEGETMTDEMKLAKAVKSKFLSLRSLFNFISETTNGVRRLKNEYNRVLMTPLVEESEKESFDKISKLDKIKELATSFKDILGDINSKHLIEIDDSNIFKKSINQALGDIEEIEGNYFTNTLPIIAKVLNDQFSDKQRELISIELDLRIKNQEELISKLVPGSRTYKYETERLENLKKEKSKMVPEVNLIESTIKGEMGDSPWWGFIIANIANPDVIISAATKKLSSILYNLRLESIANENLFGKQLAERIKVKGDLRLNQKKLNEELLYEVEHIRRDSSGNIEKWLQLHLITEVNEIVYTKYKELIYKYEDVKNDKNSTEKEILQAKEELNKFEKDNFEDYYTKEYREVLDELDTIITLDGKSINPSEMYKDIFSEMNRIRANHIFAGALDEEGVMLMNQQWRKYDNLFSDIDLQGNKKTGVNKLATDLFLLRREKLNKLRYPDSEKDSIQVSYDYATFNKLRDELISRINTENGYSPASNEYENDEEYKEWMQDNATVVTSPEFFDEYQKKIDERNAIILRLIEDPDKFKALNENLDILKKRKNRMLKPYKKGDGFYDVAFMSPEVRKQVKLISDEIALVEARILDNVRTIFKLATTEDAENIKRISQEISRMSDYWQDKAYLEESKIDKQNFIAEYNNINNKNITMHQFESNLGGVKDLWQKESEWYQNNHTDVLGFDSEMNIIKVKDKKIGIFGKVVPRNKKYRNVLPGRHFQIFTDSENVKNKEYYDQFGRRKLKTTSAYYNPSHYLKLKNGRSELDKQNYADITFLKSHLEKAQEGLFQGNMIGYAIPTEEKDTIDKVMEGHFKDATIGDLGRALKTNEQDYSEGKKDIGTDRFSYGDLEGNAIKFVPVKYTQRIDIKDQSYNAFRSIMLYEMSAQKSKKLNEVHSFYNTLLEQLDYHGVKDDSIINPLINSINNMLPEKRRINEKNISSVNNKRATELRGLIDKIFFEEYKRDTINIAGFTDTKVVDSTLKFAGTTMMFLNIPLWFINFFSGNIQLMIEAVGGKTIGLKDLKEANLILPGVAKDVVSDWGKLHDKSLNGQMIDLVDPIQGEFEDQFGNRTSYSNIKQLGQLPFTGKIFGEWELQMKTYIAIFKSIPVQVKDKNGVVTGTISLFDAFEKGDDGVPKLKEGVDYSPRQLEDAIHLVHSVNKSLNGSYNNFDSLSLSKYSIVRAIEFMRKWFAPLVLNRFGGLRQDIEKGNFSEGFYMTFWNEYIKSLIVYRSGWLKHLRDKKLTPEQLKNMRKVYFEISILLILSLMAFGFKEWDDEEDSATARYLLFGTKRIRREIASVIPVPFLGLQETYSIFRSPFVAIGRVGQVIKLATLSGLQLADYTGNLAGVDIIDDKRLYYQRESGIYPAGYSKWLATLINTAGLKASILDSQKLLDGYNLSMTLN